MTPFPRTAANYTIDSRLRKKFMKPLKCPRLLPPPPPSAIRKFSWTVSGIHGHRFRPFVERGVLRVKRIWCLIQDHNAVI